MTSPLQFARDFEKLKSDLAASPAPDLSLLLLIGFWPQLENKIHDALYKSYIDEYLSILVNRFSDDVLIDLTIDELDKIRGALLSLWNCADHHKDRLTAFLDATSLALAKIYFYLGEPEKGINNCRSGSESTDDSRETKNPTLPAEFPDSPSEIDLLRLARDSVRETSPQLYDTLTSILVEWESILESLTTDGANCLFVEKDAAGRIGRGRMRALTGQVERFTKAAQCDEITFDNHIKSPDDPFVGVAYDALAAIRNILSGKEPDMCAADEPLAPIGAPPNGWDLLPRRPSTPFLHAHFSIRNSKQTFAGDSIGLAFAMVAYAQLLKPEIQRYERFLPSNIAFTGGVDTDGRLTPVNEDTLPLKIKRAFYSPIKYLVVPSENFASAKTVIEKLGALYPRRNLRLISASTLSELIDDRNVVRSERVCAGQYIIRKASRYSRSVKVQVPILLGLMLFLLALIFPKYTPWFDWRIDHLEIMGNRFKTVNPDGHTIWVSGEFEMELAYHAYHKDNPISCRLFYSYDIDNDGKDELVFSTLYQKQEKPEIILFDHNGKEIWKRSAFVRTSYPGDIKAEEVEQNDNYSHADIFPIACGDKVYTFAAAGASFPGTAAVPSFQR
jgi:hypothetical protein